MKVFDSPEKKCVRSEDYNFNFDKKSGAFARWGVTLEDDPEYSKFGNEILDIEVSTICHQGCSFCYKANVAKGENMSFDVFKTILDKMPPTLTQIAVGVGDLAQPIYLRKRNENIQNNKQDK